MGEKAKLINKSFQFFTKRRLIFVVESNFYFEQEK